MKVSFTSNDFQTALEEFQHQTGASYQLHGRETVTMALPAKLGKGRLSRVQLRDGLALLINECSLDNDLLIAHADDLPSTAPIVLKFFLSGITSGSIQDINAPLQGLPGGNILVYCPGKNSSSAFSEGSDICTVELDITTDLFKTILSDDAHVDRFQQLLNATVVGPYCRMEKTTPLMAIALQQILQCPYQGATRRLYLESKGLELIALYLGQLEGERSQSPKPQPLKPDDVNQICQARDILIRQIDDPPSLLALARQVGINDHKLKKGFRQVFGTTVFGYLHNYRMERAAQLLQENQTTVTGVARAVGFANRGCFAAAFRRKFGVNPSDYSAARRQQYWDMQSKNSG